MGVVMNKWGVVLLIVLQYGYAQDKYTTTVIQFSATIKQAFCQIDVDYDHNNDSSGYLHFDDFMRYKRYQYGDIIGNQIKTFDIRLKNCPEYLAHQISTVFDYGRSRNLAYVGDNAHAGVALEILGKNNRKAIGGEPVLPYRIKHIGAAETSLTYRVAVVADRDGYIMPVNHLYASVPFEVRSV